MRSRHSRLRSIACAVAWLVPVFTLSFAQAQPASTGFMPGSRELFSLNLGQEQGEFPKSIRNLSGAMEIVEKDGQRMLRASQNSEFLITLPERLPDRFTLEVDLLTRAAGYNNEELAFEGTPTPNQSSASARISWYQGAVSIKGGRESDGTPVAMPADIRAQIEGQMAEIRAEFAGDNFKLYTNGRRILSLSDLKFVRARVLRVLLGGNDPGQYAVHLARLRIADATTTGPAVAQQQSAMMSTSGSNQMGPASTAAPLAITGLVVNLNASGAAVVTWNPLPAPATYFVVRWNANDPGCCNAMSPPGIPLTSPVWQDSVLPLPGTYAYRVIARTANGTIEGETRFTYGGAPTPPPGVAYPAPAAIITPPRAIEPQLVSTPGPTGGAATGTPNTGTIVGPEPAPPAPYSSGPRGVTPVTPTTPGFVTSTTGTGTSPKTGDTTGGGAAAGPGQSTPGTSGTSGTTGYVTALPATTTGTITPMTVPSGGGGAPVMRYRVLLTGFAVIKTTNDDPLNIDGKGDEAFAAAAVVNWDRRQNALKSYSFVQTRDYGDVSVATLFPERIQAGTASMQGGLKAGDRVPAGYDPTGPGLPAPATDQFPLLVWEGELTPGVEALVVAPSLWERDTVRTHFNAYKSNWSRSAADIIMGSTAVTDQYANPSLTSAMVPFASATITSPPSATFVGQVTNGYKIATLAMGPSADRPIGMTATVGVLMYQERLMLITAEKLSALKAGDGVTVAIPFAEPLDPLLNGMYMLYLRVQRVQ